MGRPPLEKKQQQLPVALPTETRSQLEASAAAAGHSLAEEIRRRIGLTLEADDFDAPTRELAGEIMRLAAEVEMETGATWHNHAGTHAAFRQAILSRLARLKPSGPTAFGTRPHQTQPDDDPQKIGIWAEHSVWETREWSPAARERLRAATIETLKKIRELHDENAQEGGKS